jgi:hypothetical protein
MTGIISDLHWQSDWNGYEVGYDNVGVVGLYTSEKLGADLYLNAETDEVLEIWLHEDGDAD